MTASAPPRRFGLRRKIVLGLLVISMVPLVATVILSRGIGNVAQNFASHEAAELRPPLVRAQAVYRRLVSTDKELYHQIAAAWAASPEIAAAVRGDAAAGGAALDKILAQRKEAVGARLEDAGHHVVAARPPPAGANRRPVWVSEPVPGGGRLEVAFAVDRDLTRQYATLGRVLAETARVDRFKASLPASYRTAFLLAIGAVVVIVTAAGMMMARRLTRRIALLVAGTREVAAGDLGARVRLGGRDELGELAGAFNRMVEDLDSDRRHIVYLQRMSAWQEVARKLAHEIKNPLTPIQLAVQQCVSAYGGDDARFSRLLADTAEIVEEEIAGLRRLVDAFRELGRLPPVEPTALDLGTVADDLRKDPALADRLEIEPPAEPVTVWGDRLLLRRVLANLVENGVQAGRAAGRAGRVALSWRTAGAGGRAEITVEDEGPGVAASDRDRIFEPYVTTKEEGTGLGLAIAKKIALEHGGRLEVAAEPSTLGGARFLLRLPLADADDMERSGGANGEPAVG